VFAWIYRLIAGNGRTFFVLIGLVVSHWVLDVVVHGPDVPLYPGGPKLGFSIWNSIPATVAIETTMFAAGVWIYVRATRARDRIGRWGLVTLVLFLMAAYLGAIGAPPPSVTALWVTSILGAAIGVLWSGWTDRHREPVPALR